MMRTFATDIITRAALAAGLPEGRVIDKTQKDNLKEILLPIRRKEGLQCSVHFLTVL